MSFGDILKRLRDETGVTQQELADYLKVGRPTIAGYETKNKQPDYEKLVKIADFFNVSIDYLLGRTSYRSLPTHPPAQEQTIDITDAQIAANMEGRYGEKPSPELVAFIKKVINEELEKRKN